MQPFTGNAIEEAMRLAREQNPIGATRLLLNRLSVGRFKTPTQPAPEERGNPAQPRIDSRVGVTSGAEGPATRLRMPLGETLARLRSGEVPSFGLDPEALSKLGKRPKVLVPEGASYLSREFIGTAGARRYKVYVPSKLRGARAPLLVMLHGCTQNPDDFAVGTGMNRLAEELGFIVAYPEQPAADNQMRCWNWFDQKHQLRDCGEPSIIAGLTRALISEMNLDRERVFVAGLSAGGAMADVMSVTYPDLYAAAGIHSGLAYGVAADQASAFMAMSGKSQQCRQRFARNRVRTVIFHGARDAKVHPINAERILTEARAGISGDCEETTQRGMSNGLQYQRTVVADAAGVQLEYWAIEGLGHAWCGGSPEGSHTERRGPDASREMLRFFLES
ncbi:extracellular catalytic domain type 1 short-chain-length polyhydroxyalkanoate depolymerase [Methylocystis heyeri]|uniref:PHB depolymerase family esterase n=1 Tax=Methylocystis heyeri TaxID=391905 RepID=A0A6B8KCB2_9HYPH|nr:PHB depolymerase family esterase [Methylocystis heyeri]QGM44665.1 PHB depolymerase family esterase [Methylocystis heyeri]